MATLITLLIFNIIFLVVFARLEKYNKIKFTKEQCKVIRYSLLGASVLIILIVEFLPNFNTIVCWILDIFGDLEKISQLANILMFILAVIAIIYAHIQWNASKVLSFIQRVERHIDYLNEEIDFYENSLKEATSNKKIPEGIESSLVPGFYLKMNYQTMKPEFYQIEDSPEEKRCKNLIFDYQKKVTLSRNFIKKIINKNKVDKSDYERIMKLEEIA